MASESQGVSPLKRRRTSGAKVAPAAAEVESLREMEGLGKDAMISSLRLACLEVGPLRTPSIGGTKKAVLDVSWQKGWKRSGAVCRGSIQSKLSVNKNQSLSTKNTLERVEEAMKKEGRMKGTKRRKEEGKEGRGRKEEEIL